MDPAPRTSGPNARAIDDAFARDLRAGDAEAWRTFLIEHHAVFERSLRLAVSRTGGMRLDTGDPMLVDEAKACFYEAFRRTFHAFDGEGRFFAFLHRTVQNFVHERRRRRAADRGTPIEDDANESDAPAVAERAVQQWQQSQRGIDAGLQSRLDDCLTRLPGLYRSVVVMHHFEAADAPLQSLAQALGATVDAIHKRYQRAIAMLKACLAGGTDHDG